MRGAPPGLPFAWSADTLRAGLDFTLTTSVGALDPLGEIAGGGRYEDLLPHTIVVDLFGYEVRCLDLGDADPDEAVCAAPPRPEAIAELEALREERG